LNVKSYAYIGARYLPSCLVVWGASDEVMTALQAALPEAWLSRCSAHGRLRQRTHTTCRQNFSEREVSPHTLMWWPCDSALPSGNSRARHSGMKRPTLDHALPVGVARGWFPGALIRVSLKWVMQQFPDKAAGWGAGCDKAVHLLEGAGTRPSRAYSSVDLHGAWRAVHVWGGFGRVYREGGFAWTLILAQNERGCHQRQCSCSAHLFRYLWEAV